MTAQANKPPRKAPVKVDKAKALKLRIENKLTYQDIADIQQTSKQAIQQALKGLVPSNKTELFKIQRADVFAELGRQLITSIDLKDIKKAPMGSRVLAAAQIYDKERLERGQSTEHIMTIHADVAAIKRGKIVDKPVDNTSCQPHDDVYDV